MSFNEFNEDFVPKIKEVDYLESEEDSEQEEHHDGQEQQADGHTRVQQRVFLLLAWGANLEKNLSVCDLNV